MGFAWIRIPIWIWKVSSRGFEFGFRFQKCLRCDSDSDSDSQQNSESRILFPPHKTDAGRSKEEFFQGVYHCVLELIKRFYISSTEIHNFSARKFYFYSPNLFKQKGTKILEFIFKRKYYPLLRLFFDTKFFKILFVLVIILNFPFTLLVTLS